MNDNFVLLTLGLTLDSRSAQAVVEISQNVARQAGTTSFQLDLRQNVPLVQLLTARFRRVPDTMEALDTLLRAHAKQTPPISGNFVSFEPHEVLGELRLITD